MGGSGELKSYLGSKINRDLVTIWIEGRRDRVSRMTLGFQVCLLEWKMMTFTEPGNISIELYLRETIINSALGVLGL